MYLDGPGMPAVPELAECLSGSGYHVLLPDLFYRSGPYEPVDPKVVFINPELRGKHHVRFMDLAKPAAIMSDTGFFLDFLAAEQTVRPGPVGVVGYCMGWRLALFAAGSYPDWIAVMASYHGGGLAGDAPSSPHLMAPRIKAKVYVPGAV